MLQDRSLTCRDCGEAFVFSSGEQAFFTSKGLTNEPQHCSSSFDKIRAGTTASPS